MELDVLSGGESHGFRTPRPCSGAEQGPGSTVETVLTDAESSADMCDLSYLVFFVL